MPGAIDLYVNPNSSQGLTDPRFIKFNEVNEFYFKGKGGDAMNRDLEYEPLLKQMDEAGVAHSVLSLEACDPKDWIIEFTRKNPERFSMAVIVDINNGMDEIWTMEDLVKNEHVRVCARDPVRSRQAHHASALLPAVREVLRARPAPQHERRHPRPASRAQPARIRSISTWCVVISRSFA